MLQPSSLSGGAWPALVGLAMLSFVACSTAPATDDRAVPTDLQQDSGADALTAPDGPADQAGDPADAPGELPDRADGPSDGQADGPAPEVGALRYYGFVGVACSFDDPIDPSAKANYLDEVAGFTNLAHVCVYGETFDVEPRLLEADAAGVRALLHIEPILFLRTPDKASPTGSRLSLRPDAEAAWSTFVAAQRDGIARSVEAFYLVDEPQWNLLPADQVTSAARILKATHPDMPLLQIEAYTTIDVATFPPEIDWIGFDRYGTPDPATDADFLADLETLRSKRSRPDQQLFLVMEAQWYPYYADFGYEQEAMADFARAYFDFARTQPDVIGLIGYIWPGGLDGPDQLGARNLPASVQDEYRRIGRLIVGASPP